MLSVAPKVGCTGQTSNERLKKTDRDKEPCAWGDDGHGRPVQGPGAGEPRTLAGQRYPARGVGVFCAYRRMKPSACRAGRRSSTADTSHDSVHRQSLPGAWARAGVPGAADRPIDLSRPCRQAVCSNPSATPRQPKLKTATTLYSKRQTWQRNSNRAVPGNTVRLWNPATEFADMAGIAPNARLEGQSGL